MSGIIRVGLAIIAFNADGQFLMGQRRNTHGDGTWAIPGGTLEFGETFAACARREMLEETGLDINHLETLSVANHVFPEHNKQFVAIYCAALITSDHPPLIREPDKYTDLQFFDDWRHLPQPLFVNYKDEASVDMIENYKRKHFVKY